MRLNRRQLLMQTLATSAVAGFVPGAAMATGRTSAGLAVVDRHLAGSKEFASMLRRDGYDVHAFDADPAFVWMNVLEPRLRARAVAITGYSNGTTLFCLAYLARQYGLEHRKAPGNFDAGQPMLRARERVAWQLTPRKA